MENEKLNGVPGVTTNNKIGRTEMALHRKTAQNRVLTARQIEADKVSRGFIWLTNGKTSKQVHPDKIAENIAAGFKRTKKAK